MRHTFLLLSLLFLTTTSNLKAQDPKAFYNVANYHNRENIKHGIKIKTNIPAAAQAPSPDFRHIMPVIQIFGYEFNNYANYNQLINLSIAWYASTNSFIRHSAASAGSQTPDVWLSKEDGKVVIFLKHPYADYAPSNIRFTVMAYVPGPESMLQGWTVEDTPLTGENQTEVQYRNIFKNKVGINTRNPRSGLDVNGTIYSKGVIIEAEAVAWSDFVFDKDYDLPTLDEVKAHIDEHKHLPGIPSEAEVKENGINLFEINAKLLQKIEELTLYTIQLNKEVSLLKEENRNIKEKLEVK